MKYYLYISDAKVDMLHRQIAEVSPTETRTTMRGGLGSWFGIERNVQHSPKSDGSVLERRLEAVCAWIRKNEEVGLYDDPTTMWIEDTLKCYVSYPVHSETGAPVMLVHFQEPEGVAPLTARRHTLLVGSAAYLMPRDPAQRTLPEPLPPGGHWIHVSKAMKEILEGADSEERFYSLAGFLAGATDGPFWRKRNPDLQISATTMFRVFYRKTIPRGDGQPPFTVCLGTPLYVEWSGA